MNRRPLILLVEDTPDDEALIVRAIRRTEIEPEVIVMRDGVEALDYLFARGASAGRDTAQQPRVIFLDLHLPRIDGFEVLTTLRADERTRALVVVVLSSSGQDEDRRRAYLLGANSYVCKPIDFDVFAEVIRQLTVYWLGLNEPPPRPPRPSSLEQLPRSG